ncbi:hypothetical protein [Deinococcus hopiensis]|nr:hypothetical protein [Deinococcus hopiensis]
MPLPCQPRCDGQVMVRGSAGVTLARLRHPAALTPAPPPVTLTA